MLTAFRSNGSIRLPRLPRLFPAAVVAVALLALTASSAAEGELEWGECLHGKLEHAAVTSKAFDEESGRNRRNYPPDRVVDYLHMKLEMRFEDLNEMRFTATETLRVAPIGAPTTGLTLDAIGLEVSSVRCDGRPVEYFQDDETIALRFDPPLPVGAEQSIAFEYVCDHPSAGMTFTPSDPSVPDYTAEVHTQGQTITNRHWFICHDAPNERMSTELIVDVPAKYSVSSNGRQVSHLISGDRAVWHWLQEKPHVSYLVSLVIGEFDIVELPHARVPMKVWVPKGTGHLVQTSYGNTGPMIDLFERRFGVPYPWDRYDQLVVKNFSAGGMENTSATSMYPTAILDETAVRDRDLDGLIAHELAHQWSGDLITCKEWAHIWLNEGFATFGSALWAEERDGEDGYLSSMQRSFRVARRDVTTNMIPTVSSIYEGPWETFRRAGNPYPKGSSILHMLRMMLGEEVFWDGMHTYFRRHALGVVETNDFRYALEDVSGQGLEWFFEQWCYRPGTPALEVTVEYDGQQRELVVNVEQTQQIDERTPAFRFTLPVHVVTELGTTVHAVEVTEKTTSFRTTLDAAPRVVAIDPYLHVLSTMKVDKPRRMWVEQLADGPTIVARQRAASALGETETAEHRALLVDLARNLDVHYNLRNSGVSALRGYGSDEARAELRRLFDDGIEEPRVRVRVVEAIADDESDEVTAVLATVADEDASYSTRIAAIKALGKRKAEADLIAELVHFSSQHEDVRTAALEALVAIDDERGLELAMTYGAYGNTDRARARAVRAVGKLAEHDRERAVDFLLDMLDDPERRPLQSAGSALADLGEERAIEPLEAMARSHSNPARRKDAEGWLETLKKNQKSEGEKTASAG